MRKIYHLSSCSTCQRIIKDLKLESHDFTFQDIKTEKITPDQLDEMKKAVGSYAELFSRRAMKFRSMGLQKRKLTEQDYRKLILEEYTFLKRPVIIVDNLYFVGNSAKTVAAAAATINKK